MGLLRTRWRVRSGRSSTFRRGPGFTLDEYARVRGFERLEDELPIGAVAAVGLDRRLRFNVLRRREADGDRGVVLAHVLEPFHSGHTDTRFAPWTVAAVALPEAVGTVVRLQARRGRQPTTSAGWRTLDAAALGLAGFTAEAAPSADDALIARTLAGGASDWLRASDGWLRFEYGCLSLAQRGFLAEAGELDRLVQTLDDHSERLRSASLEALSPVGYPATLPGPSSELDLPVAAWEVRDWIPAFAERRGLVVEDPLAFHRALPDVGLSGHAFGVFRRGDVRLVATTEVRLPENLGEDAALLAVTAPSGRWSLPQGATAIVHRGVLIVKRPRAGEGGISGPALLELAELATRERDQRFSRRPGRE